jgi:uncharacterized protein YcbX
VRATDQEVWAVTTSTTGAAAAPSAGTAAAVVALWRYPVKSMLGEELNAAALTERGLVGDRAYALVDRATGKVASAKNPRKWGTLFDCRATFVAPPQPGAPPPVRIELPDGRVVTSGTDDVDGALSELLGREVALKAIAPEAPSLEEYWPDIEGLAHREAVTDEGIGFGAPAGTFFDAFPLHLVTTATLDRLRALYPTGRFEVRRFRPNLVVATANGEEGFVENGWVGRSVAVGEGVRLRVTGPCPRCVMTTLPQADLPRDVGILRTAADHNRVPIPAFDDDPMPSVGVYAAVERSGPIQRGDTVRLA